MKEHSSSNDRLDFPDVEKPLCPYCEGPASTTLEDETFTYGLGENAVELHVRLPVRRCDACDFEFLDHVGERIRHETICRHHGVLSPWEIRAIRERRKLSRAAFADITGLGEATIKRWETAGVFQNTANDRYLRLLDTAFGWTMLKRLVASEKESTARPPQSGSEKVRFPHLSNDPDRSKRQETFRLRSAA